MFYKFALKIYERYASFLFSKKHNSTKNQKPKWENYLIEYDKENMNSELFGYDWGDVNDKKSRLGNLLHIKNTLQKKIHSHSTVLEIGTLGGRWTRCMLHAKKIICVDINEYFIDYIKSNFPKEALRKFSFYVSSGNDLNGVKDCSCDLVFSMDSLVRVEKKFNNYFKEMYRVLKDNGEVIIHLPNIDVKGSKDRNFTRLNTKEIKNIGNNYFKEYYIDYDTINHGILLFGKK